MTEQPNAAVPEFDLADRMRKALRHGGITVAQMADYLGVSRKSVGNWIGGRVEPGIQTLRLWALRTGVDYGWLAGDSRPARRARHAPAAAHTSSNPRSLTGLAQVRALGRAA